MTDILMATYNGERFIGEQIRSICEQTYKDWQLWIHDDGSNDKTVEIVHFFCESDNRIHLVNDEVKHLGVARNFLHLLPYSHGAFCMFSDQDDVWLPEKIEQMVDFIQKQDNNKPQVCFSNAYLWKGEKIISDKTTLTFPETVRQLLFLNTGIQGASSIFNNRMVAELQKSVKFVAMHDHLLTLAGVMLGEIHYLHKPLMQYRIHEMNVTGDAPGSFLKKILLLWQNRHEPLVSQAHYDGVSAFYDTFVEMLTPEDKLLVEHFLTMPNMNHLKRIFRVYTDKFQLFDSTILLLIKMCIRKYIGYKK